jgi:hypothetical protein
MRAWTLLLTATLLGCAGAGAGAGGGAGASASVREPLPVVAMTLLRDGGHDSDEPIIDLAADGTITGDKGRFRARIDAGKIVTAKGDVLLTVTPDGTVAFGEGHDARFDDSDALVSDHDRVEVGDDGVPTVRSGREVMRFPAHFVPFDKAARRTAVVLAIIALEAAFSHGLPT